MYILTAAPVRIGLQQTIYSVNETDGYQVVCAEIQSGDIDERTIEISYSTTSGTALGTWLALWLIIVGTQNLAGRVNLYMEHKPE